MESPPELSDIAASLNKAIDLMRRGNGRSRYPYYNESSANLVIDAVHLAVTQGKPIIWPASGVSIMTLYNRFRQGAQYATDYIDPEFQDKLKLVITTRIPKVGLKIYPREGVEMLINPDLKWRNELEVFLEEAQSGQAYERINLPLSDDDRDWIAITMESVKELFMYELSKHRLLVVRVK